MFGFPLRIAVALLDVVVEDITVGFTWWVIAAVVWLLVCASSSPKPQASIFILGLRVFWQSGRCEVSLLGFGMIHLQMMGAHSSTTANTRKRSCGSWGVVGYHALGYAKQSSVGKNEWVEYVMACWQLAGQPKKTPSSTLVTEVVLYWFEFYSYRNS